MFSRGVNGPSRPSHVEELQAQRESGITPPSQQAAADHRMEMWWSYKDPQRDGLANKPLVDVSTPLNPLDEAHQARKFGVSKQPLGFISLNEFVGTYEEAPYAESHHTSEIVKIWMVMLNTWQLNNILSRAQSSGLATGNRSVRYAWNITAVATLLRTNIAGIIGIGGYFYTYEYLYTYGPWPFGIRDPTLNGWKRAWEDGQECFAARAAASVWPALGYAFFKGRWKKSGFFFGLTLVTSLYYEYARRYVLSGNRLFYSYLANQELQRQAGWGSLAPNLKHRVDPDTNKNESVADFKYFRLMSGTMQNTIWENVSHETVPLYRPGKKLRNPYFNWQKAHQNYNAAPYVRKNDMWEMPGVLGAQMRSGAMD